MTKTELPAAAGHRVPDRLLRMLQACGDAGSPRFPATEVFNEGWMLRLLLDAFQQLAIQDHPLSFAEGSSWYSEARLLSPFRPRLRPDPLGEGFTNADAVIGHFDFHEATRAGMRLLPGAQQFIVIEAKLLSDLSKGTRNAPAYDQAARNVACMAEAVARAGLPLEAMVGLGFYVIAPERSRRRPSQRLLDTAVTVEAIGEAVRARVAGYAIAGRAEAAELAAWEASMLKPLLERMAEQGALQVLTWEACIGRVVQEDPRWGAELLAFYERALELAVLQPGLGEMSS